MFNGNSHARFAVSRGERNGKQFVRTNTRAVGDTCYIISAVARTSSSCQFCNIIPITDVTLEVCNSDYSSDLSQAWKSSARKIIRVDTIPYVGVCSTSPSNGKASYFERQILDPLGNTEHSPEDTNRGCLIRSSWCAKPERWSSSEERNTVEFGIRPITLLFIV